jgi:hypothetical protein
MRRLAGVEFFRFPKKVVDWLRPKDDNVPHLQTRFRCLQANDYRNRTGSSQRNRLDRSEGGAPTFFRSSRHGVQSMSMRRIVALQASLLLLVVAAHAASRDNGIKITILDSETKSVSLGGNDVPKNCDGVNFDAYCNNSKSALLTNTLLVQEGNAPPFRVACNIDSKWSRCIPLPKGESFQARKVKHGLVIYYVDDKDKPRSQLYTLVDKDNKDKDNKEKDHAAMATASTAQPLPVMMASAQSSPATATPTEVVQEPLREKAKCSFSSTPAGAEITLDGRYVGDTPSALGLTTGTHVVVLALPGYARWKRELTVLPGSELTVTAAMQKAP